jgi:diaminopimelate epimerase
MSAAIPFRKMNGLGNEIVMVDLRGCQRVFTPAQARSIAARPTSRFDQMMVLHAPRTPGSEAFVRIYNRDGSLAEACGNGIRGVGWVVAQQIGRPALTFETEAGLVSVTVAGIDCITVDMGAPKFAWADIPLATPVVDTRKIELEMEAIGDPRLRTPSVVNIGNPHAVFWVADPSAHDLAGIGPPLEHHPMFPQRANISLAHVASPSAITVRTWERGAGLTKACGSAACAAAVCAARNGATERRVLVTLPGGALEIHWRFDDRILMTGPIAIEHEGVLDLDGAWG